MLTELGRNAIILGGVLLALPLLGFTGRWRAGWAWVLALGAAITGLSLGILIPSDLWTLPGATGLGPDLLALVLWALFGVLARSAGGPRLWGPPVVVAPLMGALLGSVPAAALLAAGSTDRKGAARLALGAAAGGMIGRVGDPALLLLGERGDVLILAPLGLILALVAWPRAADLRNAGLRHAGLRYEGGRLPVTLVALAVALLCLVPGLRPWALGGGVLAMAPLARARELDPRPALWALGGAALVLMWTAAGGAELVASGLEGAQERLGAVGLAGAGALVSALVDGPAAATLGASVLDRALALRIPGAVPALAAGIAAGGLGPLVAAGAVRAGVWRWLLAVGLTLTWVALWW